MDVGSRIAYLLVEEHARLRAALIVTNGQITGLKLAPPRGTPIPAPVRKGQTAPPPPPREWDCRHIQRSWTPFHELLVPHMERERELFKLCVLPEPTDEQRAEIGTGVESLQVEHALLRRFAGAVRVDTLGAPPEVKKPVSDILKLFEEHTSIEEKEIFAGLETGHADTKPDETAEEILKSLRANADEAPPAAPKGLFERLKGMFAKK